MPPPENGSRSRAAATAATAAASSVAVLPTVRLKRNHQSKAFRHGNPLVFDKSVVATTGTFHLGDLVHVTLEGGIHPQQQQQNLNDVPLGWGVYNPNPQTMYRIRMLNHCTMQPHLYQQLLLLKDTTSNDGDEEAARINETRMRCILQHQFRQALHLRRYGLGLPNAQTDTYRLVNSEGDGLSGLAVDVIGHTNNNNNNTVVVVVMSSAGWVEQYRSLIATELAQLLETDQIVWKTTPARLRQDGYSADVDSNDNSGSVDGHDNHQSNNDIDHTDATPHKMVLSMENGIVYETYPTAPGQKTGVYCDQRDNRWRMGQHCQNNKRVLDLCCYTGGFSLQAAKAGARHCTGVDSSAAAIEACRANALRNQLEHVTTFVQSDITTFLQSCVDEYDVVILDPPKLAPSVKNLDSAQRKYHALNRDAIRVVNAQQGGLLLTCTCSAAMTQSGKWVSTIQAAALSAQRQVTLLSTHGAAPCHTVTPALGEAAQYLTAALFFVHPTIDPHKSSK